MIFRFPMGLWALLMITVSTSVLGAPVGESVAEAVPELDCVIEPSDIAAPYPGWFRLFWLTAATG